MSVLLQISDIHFGTEQPQVVEALAALTWQQRPALLVLSGDIPQRALPAQFRAARAFVDRLGVPVLAVAGNHDVPLFDLWTRLRRPYARHIAAFGSDLEPVHAFHSWAIGLQIRQELSSLGPTLAFRRPKSDRLLGGCSPPLGHPWRGRDR